VAASAGDGFAIEAEEVVSMTASDEKTEILLFDLP
jgi:hypothetical protein